MSKQILILNGSPRIHGNTAALIDAFTAGAEAAGHTVALGVGELGHQLGIGGIGDVDHVQVVHGLGALAGAGGENLFVVEGDSAAATQ